MNAILEILKFTIPALIVWGVVYWMVTTYLDRMMQRNAMKDRLNVRKETLPMKIQALERLSLFCERIQPNQVLSRVQAAEMNSKTLGRAMLIAVQKEFEHNVTQQIYVSDALWEIIYITKNEVLNLITEAMDEVDGQQPGSALAQQVIEREGMWKLNPVWQALQAIRKEASIILNS